MTDNYWQGILPGEVGLGDWICFEEPEKEDKWFPVTYIADNGTINFYNDTQLPGLTMRWNIKWARRPKVWTGEAR